MFPPKSQISSPLVPQPATPLPAPAKRARGFRARGKAHKQSAATVAPLASAPVHEVLAHAGPEVHAPAPAEAALEPNKSAGFRAAMARLWAFVLGVIAGLWRPKAFPLVVAAPKRWAAELAPQLEDASLKSTNLAAKDALGRTLPVSDIFAKDFHRSAVTIGERHFDGADVRLEEGAQALLALCGQDAAWSQRVSSLLSQHVGNTLCVDVFAGQRLAWRGQAVHAWAQKTTQNSGVLRLSARRLAYDSVEVVVAQSVEVAKLGVASPDGAVVMHDVSGSLATQVTVRVPKDPQAPLEVAQVWLDGALA